MAVWTLGAGVAVGVHLLRSRVQAYLPDTAEGWLNPRTWLGWLEVGGVVGVLAAVFLAPFVALAVVIFASVAGVAALVAGRGLEQIRSRRPCSACERRVRVEASRCSGCGADIPVARWLS